MRLILDPTENAAHGDWLRSVPGAYEWWYFDALSDDRQWALTCIWFLGNPFSPYYRLASLGKDADPYEHNALFFALYRQGRLHAYHFTRFARFQVSADEIKPATLQFGSNTLASGTGKHTLCLDDENANGRIMAAQITFEGAPVCRSSVLYEGETNGHHWLPAMPACRVEAQVSLSEARNIGGEQVSFLGSGYHDHNWGQLPFSAEVRDWYWVRAEMGMGQALVVYHIDYYGKDAVTYVLRFRDGRIEAYDDAAKFRVRRRGVNGFAMAYATHIEVQSGGMTASLFLQRRLDSAPFYVRTLAKAVVHDGASTAIGYGLGEYFRPKMLSWPLVASATKARIVER